MVTGTAPNRRFVVEWRNVKFWADQSRRVTVEAILYENGTIALAYQGIDANALEQGSKATVGIENGAGTVALQYSFNQPVLQNSIGVTIIPPS